MRSAYNRMRTHATCANTKTKTMTKTMTKTKTKTKTMTMTMIMTKTKIKTTTTRGRAEPGGFHLISFHFCRAFIATSDEGTLETPCLYVKRHITAVFSVMCRFIPEDCFPHSPFNDLIEFFLGGAGIVYVEKLGSVGYRLRRLILEQLGVGLAGVLLDSR